MIKLEKSRVFGFDSAIRGMRNPMNSWDKSDSIVCSFACDDKATDCDHCKHRDFTKPYCIVVGPSDYDLMLKLVKSGNDHAKFMRMINVTIDITAPFYWWKEFDTYKVGTVANSCSTMHKITAKEFDIDDFSHEHLYPSDEVNTTGNYMNSTSILKDLIGVLNFYRNKYLDTKDKKDWWQLIQLLPSSYNQKRTVQLNYAVLRNIYFSRKNHKLDEWHDFCNWIESLPYAELITTEN